MQLSSLPWPALGLPDDFRLRHLALALAGDAAFTLDHGEVTRAESLDSRRRAVAGGMICPAIFGEPGETDRFGHIMLPAAIIHPLLLVRAPAWLAQRTGVSREGLRQLVDYQRWVVVDAASDSGVEVGSLVDQVAAEELHDDPIELLTGAQAIERLLAIRGHASISLSRVRVLPIGLRPNRSIDDSAEAAVLSDVEDFYRRAINRAFRLRRLLELEAPEIIVRNEIIMTQAAVESLFCNEARESPTLARDNRPMQSLLGLAGGPAIAEVLLELDARVGLAGPSALTDSLPLPLLRSVRVIQALHLELHPI